jgi:hypothetical protein
MQSGSTNTLLKSELVVGNKAKSFAALKIGSRHICLIMYEQQVCRALLYDAIFFFF